MPNRKSKRLAGLGHNKCDLYDRAILDAMVVREAGLELQDDDLLLIAETLLYAIGQAARCAPIQPMHSVEELPAVA